jgi:SAM-dependent methyltransferase
MPNTDKAKEFYEAVDRIDAYTVENDPEKHPFYDLLVQFVQKWSLNNSKCLEIGSSKGLFQDIVKDYTGVDIAESLSGYYHKKFIATPEAGLPFRDNTFDAIFTYATHEHVPDIEQALEEIIRVLKPGGVCLFAPAWHSRPWFAQGYQVRNYSDLTIKEKLIKFSIPFRDFFLFRWIIIIFRRIFRLIFFRFSPKHIPLRYKKLTANYEQFWQSDSDACNSLDPFDVILWFRSRGIQCIGFETLPRTLFVRTLSLELRKPFR